MSDILVSFHHAEEGRDLNGTKEQQKQRFPRNAPSPHRAKLLAKTINQGLSPHGQRL
jgi:hypothetical protein